MIKRIIILMVVILTFGSAKAQDLTFEQTVSYLQKKIIGKTFSQLSGSTEYEISDVEIKKNGDISIMYGKRVIGSYNIFQFKGTKKIELVADSYVGFEYSDRVVRYVIMTESSEDALRVIKALNHLKNVCQKEKDPFDN